MADYYEYGPQLQLPAPTVVTGYLTEFTRAVTYRASSLLGLPYQDVDRLVEHDAGMDIARLVFEEGEAAYRDLESQMLERALHQRPLALIALGDGGLLRSRNQRLIQDSGLLIVLDFELASLYWRVQRLARRNELTGWQVLHGDPPDHLDQMRPYFQARRAAFDGVRARIDASSLNRSQACRALIECVAGQSN